MCKITYYLGCLLKKGETKGFQLYNKNNSYFNGVKYIDTVELKLKNMRYSLNFRNSYNVFYYDFVYETNKVKYGNTEIETPKTRFEVHIDHGLESEENGISFTSNNTMIDSPVFKEELKLGISSLQNVEENIYIERAIIKPHEKNLRLIDIMSIEALEKYGNGSLKILNN